MTLAMAKSLVKLYGYTLAKVDGEYQVRVRNHPEWNYYTDDIEDAVSTARVMFEDRIHVQH